MPKQKASHPQTEQNIQEFEKHLLQTIADFSNPEEVKTFMNDFFTDSEKVMFIKRFAVLLSLQKGESYQTIQKKYGVSSATISTIREHKEKKGVQLILKKIETERWAQQWVQKLSTIFSIK